MAKEFAHDVASIGQDGEVVRAELIRECGAKFENRCNSKVALLAWPS